MHTARICKQLALLLTVFIWITTSFAGDDAWLLGKWELTYDPDGAKKDFLEFLGNGDAYSTGPLGKQNGFYVVSDDSVKAVFTYKDKDIIMTFHFNETRDELRIVTSHTGRESIYKRVQQ
jgi:cytosine/adenosine deaminase-related metal-dependent hydrolase